MRALLILACLAGAVHAEPINLHLNSSSHLVTSGGSVLDLPPGRFMDDDVYAKLDAEVRRLQNAETRLNAENTSLRKSLDTWQPGPYTLVLTFISGFAAGVYLWSKL